MNERVRVGIAQWLAVPGDPDANLRDACDYVRELAGRGADLVVLPEMWVCGYRWSTIGADTRESAEPLDGPRGETLSRLAYENGIWLVAGSVPELVDGAIYNTAPVYDRTGRLRSAHRKAHLYEPLGEERVFAAGDRVTVLDTDELGRIGVSICFDGDFPEMARALRRHGVTLVVEPAAYELSAARWWDTLYPAHALSNGQWWIMANQCGTHSADTLLGASQVISPAGDVVALAPRAQLGETPEPYMLVADIALHERTVAAERDQSVLWTHSREDIYR